MTVQYQVGDVMDFPDAQLSYLGEGPHHYTSGGNRKRQVVLRCQCGAEVTTTIQRWRTGHTKSCGCLQRSGENYRRGSEHRMCRTPIYYAWQAMKQRTTPGSSRQKANPNYEPVGRDPRWDRFEAFYEDMNQTYFPNAVLGRIGDVGDYEPDNVRWQTKQESIREMLLVGERIHRLDDGRVAVDVARANGLSGSAMLARLRRGWSLDQAVTLPKHTKLNHFTKKSRTLAEAAKKANDE